MNLSPLAASLRRALRDNPAWAEELPLRLGIALWAYGYTDHKPTRHEVEAALEELRQAKQRRRW